MNWEAIGAIGQMLGSLAVFVTLGYLAVQVRDTRQEMQRSISLGRAEVLREMAITLATDARLNNLNVRADAAMGRQTGKFRGTLMEISGFTLEDSAALSWEQMAWWQYRVQIIADIDSLRPGERQDFDQATRKIYGLQPVPKLWYQVQKGQLDPDAVRYVDSLLAQTG